MGNTTNLDGQNEIVESEASPPDLVEFYSVHGRPEQWGAEVTPEREAFPPLPSVLNDTVREYHAACEKVLYALNTMSAAALGLEPDFFDKFYHPSPDLNVLRMAHYPPMPS